MNALRKVLREDKIKARDLGEVPKQPKWVMQ